MWYNIRAEGRERTALPKQINYIEKKKEGKIMKYNVSINEKSKTITVTLADGYKGVAKCCDTDQFNLATGIELALERAKVAKKEAEAKKATPTPTPTASGMSVRMLVKELEKALPKGQVVVVGNGKEPTAEQKAWLHSLTDCDGGCCCDCDGDCDRYSETEMEDACDEAHDEGYAEGYEDGYEAGLTDAQNELDEEKIDEALENIRSLIEGVLGM